MYESLIKVFKFLVSITLSISSFFSFLPSNKQIAEMKENPPDLPFDFSITAHSGAMLTFPNSLWSLKQIVVSDVDIVEFDVTFRPDGTPVLKHASKAAKWQGTLLSDALEIISAHDSMKINLDLKASWNLPAVQDLVEEYDMLHRVFFTGVREEQLPDVQQENIEIPYYLNVTIKGDIEDEEMLASLVRQIKDCGAIGINLNYKGASKALCEIMHENDLLVSVWTVNRRLPLHKMLEIGADNITTKRPNKLLKIIEDW